MRTNLDIDIQPSHNSKTIIVLDTSFYNEDSPVEDPTIDISIPGFSNYVRLDFLPTRVNVFNSNSLKLSRVYRHEDLSDLPDGVYKVTYSTCPKEILFVSKSFMRTSLIECKFDKAFMTLDLTDECKEAKAKRELFSEIQFLIQGAISNGNLCNQEEANRLYQMADKKLDKIINQTC